MSQLNKPTSLEEFDMGGGLLSLETLNGAEALLCSDASSSVAGLHAWEALFSAWAQEVYGTNIVSAPFPCGTISSCLKYTPYLANSDVGLIHSVATEDFGRIFGDPFEMVRIKRESAKRRAEINGSSMEAANSKVSAFLANFPASIFGILGVPYSTIVLNDSERLVKYLQENLFPAASGKFRIENPMDSNRCGEITFLRLANLLEQISGKKSLVMMKCVCPECSYSGPLVEHVIGSDGKVSVNYSAYIAGNHKSPRCTYMRPIVSMSDEIFDHYLATLINAGFMPQGICLYLLEAMNHSQNPNLSLGIRDYSNPRGIIGTALNLWEKRVVLTPRGYIKYGERDASVYELTTFTQQHGFDLLREFLSKLPIFGDGRAYILDLNDGSIEIK